MAQRGLKVSCGSPIPAGLVRGENFEVSNEDGALVYSVQWESPVQGLMDGREKQKVYDGS
ncbi:MAG: hypothetical protein IKU63_04925 [Bacteroidaceae bacterium]|nr:hypothetical protein [Bacteroidaceae bacterium]